MWLEYQKRMVEFAHLFVLIQPVYQVAVRKNVSGLKLTAAGWMKLEFDKARPTSIATRAAIRRLPSGAGRGDGAARHAPAIFLIANSVPGDPVLLQLGDLGASNPIMVAAFRHKWGLDLPLWERYGIFLNGLLHGNLGNSIAFSPAGAGRHRRLCAHRRPSSLSTIAFALALAVGLPLGVLAAVRRDSWIDHLARVLSLVGVSAPTFWLAFVMLAMLFYGALDWAPGPGRLDAIAFPPPRVTGFLLIDTVLAGDWDTFHDAAAHLVLPSIVLASGTLGLITRTTRAAMLEALSQDYVRVAHAKGLREWMVVLGHALPNALLPVVTLGGLAYANLLSGAVLTETVFSWPGLGRYTFQSAVSLDFPAITGITTIVAVVFVLVNFMVDMSYALLDPRVVKK